MYKIILGLLAIVFMITPASAQVSGGSPVYQNWFPQGISPSVAISSASSAHLFPGIGPTARMCNRGTVDSYVNIQGTNNTVTATTNSNWLPAGTCQVFNLKPGTLQYTYWAGITASGTTNIYVETGLGAPSASNGSGGWAGPPLIYGAITTQTADCTATSGDGEFLANSSGGNFTITVPRSLGSFGVSKVLVINKIGTDSNIVTIADDTGTPIMVLIASGQAFAIVTVTGGVVYANGVS